MKKDKDHRDKLNQYGGHSQEYAGKLVKRVPCRCQAIINNEKDWTSYEQ